MEDAEEDGSGSRAKIEASCEALRREVSARNSSSVRIVRRERLAIALVVRSVMTEFACAFSSMLSKQTESRMGELRGLFCLTVGAKEECKKMRIHDFHLTDLLLLMAVHAVPVPVTLRRSNRLSPVPNRSSLV